MRRQKVQNPIYRALASCAVGVAGIYAGLSYLIPTYGNLGIAWTMLCAVVTGVFYTRYVTLKKAARRQTQS